MSCCGGKNRSIRSTSKPIQKETVKPIQPTTRKVTKNSSTPVAPNRQSLVHRQACPKCGHPTMLVHIARRERQQCTNPECKLVLQ